MGIPGHDLSAEFDVLTNEVHDLDVAIYEQGQFVKQIED